MLDCLTDLPHIGQLTISVDALLSAREGIDQATQYDGCLE